MSARQAAPQLRNVHRPVAGDEVASFLRGLGNSPVVSGRLLACTLDGTAEVQAFRHGLGRVFQGVWVVALDEIDVPVFPGSVADVIAAGLDPSVWVRLNPTSTTSQTCTVWVF